MHSVLEVYIQAVADSCQFHSLYRKCLPGAFSSLSVSLLPNYLEAVERHKESQNVVGALKDTEDSQVSQDPLNTSVLQQNTTMTMSKCLAAMDLRYNLFRHSPILRWISTFQFFKVVYMV